MVATDVGKRKESSALFWTSGPTRHNSRFPFLPFFSSLMVQLYNPTVDLLFLRGRNGLPIEGESERGHADLLLFGMREKKERERNWRIRYTFGTGDKNGLDLFTFLSPTYRQCFK